MIPMGILLVFVIFLAEYFREKAVMLEQEMKWWRSECMDQHEKRLNDIMEHRCRN